MTSKITPEARNRCAAHTLKEQLEQLRAIHALERALLEKRQAQELEDAGRALAAENQK